MIKARVEFVCPCSPEAKIIADPMIVCEKRADDFCVECCQCGCKYYLIAEKVW